LLAVEQPVTTNPQGNGQAEKYNGTIWKAVTMALKSSELPAKCWQAVLPDALHSIRSLLSTATNATPRERMFNFTRRSSSGHSMPSWLCEQGTVLLRRHVRHSKTEPLVDEVELLQANPNYAHVRYADGRETTVSTRHLAPAGGTVIEESKDGAEASNMHTTGTDGSCPESTSDLPDARVLDQNLAPVDDPSVRRSGRIRKPPERLNL